MAILKGMKGHAQPNHQMTPDTIGYMISYFSGKFLGARTDLSIMDPAVGTEDAYPRLSIGKKMP